MGAYITYQIKGTVTCDKCGNIVDLSAYKKNNKSQKTTSSFKIKYEKFKKKVEKFFESLIKLCLILFIIIYIIIWLIRHYPK